MCDSCAAASEIIMTTRITNEMEEAVRAELAEEKARTDRGGVCWCELCEADIIALTLTSLPPQYCTSRCRGTADDGRLHEQVRHALRSSVERVGHNPKHLSSDRERKEFSPRLINFNFEEGVDSVSDIMDSAFCTCEHCCADTLAMALNRYPSKYGVELEGSLKFPARERASIRRELGLIMNHAAEVVAERPRHTPQGNL